MRLVLELLKEDPGFEMCGFFSLSRARLVEIACFAATYFIILLQFRSSETNSDTG
ncbi:Gustatory receptor 10 [Hyalella azteca]|uniref:Gustatory receptor 10 n=1 Tax=Hyalella azteca TaxID=294128 RepID=A0A6A0GUC7_HYAAZ|nr:Gustatory receptor 10 [Hyalella azteca]